MIIRPQAGKALYEHFFLDFRTGISIEAFALIQLLAERGNVLRLPHSRSLGEGLNELRGKQVRIFYVFRPQKRVVLLDGMLKKREDIPVAVLKRLRQLQRTVQ